jgi:hypothetical protein
MIQPLIAISEPCSAATSVLAGITIVKLAEIKKLPMKTRERNELFSSLSAERSWDCDPLSGLVMLRSSRGNFVCNRNAQTRNKNDDATATGK